MDNDTSTFDANLSLMQEAAETLLAIRQGAVDAFVVEEATGNRVYTLEGSDLPYSVLVERMQQGAAMLDAHGAILYCNLGLAHLLRVPRETVIGLPLQDFIASEDQPLCQKLVRQSQAGSSEGEMRLRRPDDTVTSARFAFSVLSQDKSAVGVLVTDLTAQKQLAELAARLLQMRDEERKRLARELHDSVGQMLAAISMNIGVVSSEAHKLSPAAAKRVSENAALVEQVSREIRTMSHLLHPPLLDIAGLSSAVRWYVDGFSERSKIKVDLHIPEDLGRLPDDMEIAIFRIIQECLTNIHRHSGSPTAAIRIYREEHRLIVQIRDEGKGIPREKQVELTELGRAGVGLGGIRERLRQLGGALEIQSEGSGTEIRAVLKIA